MASLSPAFFNFSSTFSSRKVSFTIFQQPAFVRRNGTEIETRETLNGLNACGRQRTEALKLRFK